MIQMSRAQWQSMTAQDWYTLGVYQDFYQSLLIEVSQGTHEETRLKTEVSQRLAGVEQKLFMLTAHELIGHLIDLEYCDRTDGQVHLNQHWYKQVLQQQSLWVEEEEVPVPTTEDQSSVPPKQVKQAIQEYLDPLSYVSKDYESLFTAHRLERVLNALDGLTLLETQLQELLDVKTKTGFNTIIDTMERYELIRRESPFIRLNVHGNKVVRLNRSEKQKALGRLASRMRKEEKSN